jgi:2-hydroxychromene-2-carboxylate isomerase
MTVALTLYSDYKSPYAYLVKDLAYELEDSRDVAIDWRPYTLDIPDYLGSAKVDAQGNVVESQRTAHQWRRVRYSYMDVRRYANLRGLTIRGTQKIWDSRLANTGLLWAKRAGGAGLRRYNDITFDRFWKRELDIEDPAVVAGVLDEAGIDASGFADWAESDGSAEHDRIRTEAEDAGIFGVPTFVLDGEIFWGREHLELIGLRLDAMGYPAA